MPLCRINSPIRTKSGIATRLKLVVVLKTMSPNVGHSMVPLAMVMPTMPTNPIAAPIEAPNASVATSRTP